MIKFDYVVSGTSMIRLYHQKKYDEELDFLEKRYKLINNGIDYIKNKLANDYPMFDLQISALYNGYTEKTFGTMLRKNFKCFDNIYADSGGLQVITTGAKLTPELKSKVYETQDVSDFSFCFDEIPIKKLDEIEERSSDNRIFLPNLIKEKATETAMNVLEQINSLKHSKVLYIIQGNTIDDMVKWFEYGANILGEENINKLGGLAVSLACMGFKELESIDCLAACKIIFDKYPNLNKRLHLLGFGAAKKIIPALIFANSNFLKDVTISADSTSQSMSFMMGHAKTSNGIVHKNKEKQFLASYLEFAKYMEPFYKKYVPDYNVSEFANLILINNRSVATLEDLLFDDKNHKYHNIAGSVVQLYCMWNIDIMINECNSWITNEYKNKFIELNYISTIEEYYKWRSKNLSNLSTGRIKRLKKNLFFD